MAVLFLTQEFRTLYETLSFLIDFSFLVPVYMGVEDTRPKKLLHIESMVVVVVLPMPQCTNVSHSCSAEWMGGANGVSVKAQMLVSTHALLEQI